MIEEYNENFPEQPKPYQLNWDTQQVNLAKGRFKFFLKRPSAPMILERDLEVPSEVPIAKDKSYALNAGSVEQDEIDARYCDKITAQEPEGYKGSIPKSHKAQAFRSLYRRHVFIPEHASAFDDVVEVWEVIGDTDSPAALIKHFLNQPEEKELTSITNAINNARLAPDKNGKQKLVTKSSLAKAMAFYRKQLSAVENAYITKTKSSEGEESTVEKVFFKPELRDEFISQVDPLIQEMVVAVFVREASDLMGD